MRHYLKNLKIDSGGTSLKFSIKIVSIALILSIVISTGCTETALELKTVDSLSPHERAIQETEKIDLNNSTERDNIFMMLAYAVVLKDWQNGSMDKNRGYNIGSVLVDKNNTVVYWGRNCVNEYHSMTQHGEVRLMTNYLQNNTERDNLTGYTVYTTLEPCAMCSGMMLLTNVTHTIWGQEDPSYGDALERLELNSTVIQGGYPPYPRYVQTDGSKLIYRYWLDYEYQEYMNKTGTNSSTAHITKFLATDEAKFVFQNTTDTFMTYKVKYDENQKYLDQARRFYETVPGHSN